MSPTWQECMKNWTFFSIHRETYEKTDPEIKEAILACLMGSNLVSVQGDWK